MKTVSDIIAKWPRTRDFALDCGVEWMTAHQWNRRNKIPPEYWASLVKGAKKRSLPVTEKVLADIHAARKRSAPKARKRQQRQADGVAA
jgi:hypothetical protein